ncbi:hypothetical protein K525DRAFT_275207 [Schizophyllum commune Loenen D]|nr:hypothetical protein K525DRAFT_275207 [Schizophyllum commune Loenen D]
MLTSTNAYFHAMDEGRVRRHRAMAPHPSSFSMPVTSARAYGISLLALNASRTHLGRAAASVDAGPLAIARPALLPPPPTSFLTSPPTPPSRYEDHARHVHMRSSTSAAREAQAMQGGVACCTPPPPPPPICYVPLRTRHSMRKGARSLGGCPLTLPLHLDALPRAARAAGAR